MQWIGWAAITCLFAVGAPAQQPKDTAPSEVKTILVDEWANHTGNCLGALKWLVTGTGPANNTSPKGETPFSMALALLEKYLPAKAKERNRADLGARQLR